MVENAVAVLEENSDYTADIEVFDDVIQPNVALSEESVDANFFQHKPYLESFNESNGTNLVPWGDKGIYLLQFGIFSENIENIDEITEGSQIVFGRDPSNRAIALKFLEELDLIELNPEVELPDLTSIVENPLNLQFTEFDITAVSDALEDEAVTAVIVMGFSLANSGKDPSTAMAYASNDLALEFQQVLTVNEEDKDSDWGQALYDAFTSDTMAKYYEENLKGSVRLLDAEETN